MNSTIRIALGLQPPRKELRDKYHLPLERYVGNDDEDAWTGRDRLEEFFEDVQNVTDFPYFKIFVTRYGVDVVYESPDGSYNKTLKEQKNVFEHKPSEGWTKVADDDPSIEKFQRQQKILPGSKPLGGPPDQSGDWVERPSEDPEMKIWICVTKSDLDDELLMQVWQEEKHRFEILREDIARVYASMSPKENNEKPSLQDLATSESNLLMINKYIKGTAVSIQIDDEWKPFLLLTAPTLECATFLALYSKLAQSSQFKKCARKKCNVYFFSDRKGKEHCTIACSKKKSWEEPSVLTKQRAALRQRLRRNKEIDATTRDLIRETINNTSLLDDKSADIELKAIEEEYDLGPKK